MKILTAIKEIPSPEISLLAVKNRRKAKFNIMHLTSQVVYGHVTLKKHLFIHNFISAITTVIKIECFLTTFGACHKGPMRSYYSYKIEQKKGSHFPILGSMVVINWTIDFLDKQGFYPKIYFTILVLRLSIYQKGICF